MDYEALGRRVRTQRKLLGITQEELSERVGVSCSYIGLIERGDRKLSIETLVSLSEALRISCDSLLQDSLRNTMSLELTGMNEKGQRLLLEIADIFMDNPSLMENPADVEYK